MFTGRLPSPQNSIGIYTSQNQSARRVGNIPAQGKAKRLSSRSAALGIEFTPRPRPEGAKQIQAAQFVSPFQAVCIAGRAPRATRRGYRHFALPWAGMLRPFGPFPFLFCCDGATHEQDV